MQRQVDIIGAAWGLGGVDPGCARAAALLAPLLEARLRAVGVVVRRGAMLAPSANERRRELAISRACGQLAHEVADSLRSGRFPCVLGGDHSCAAGTWNGAARALRGPLGLLWVDAHMDSHTPATSPSGRLHGMPLAWLLGEHDDALYGLASAAVEPEHVCLVGVHSFEPEEAERLERLGVRVFFMEEVRSRGLGAVFADALQIVSHGTAGYGVTIDMDALDLQDAPGVSVPEVGGIAGRDLLEAMGKLQEDARLVALELVEYCPPRDREQRTAQLAVRLLAAALSPARDEAKVLAQALDRNEP